MFVLLEFLTCLRFSNICSSNDHTDHNRGEGHIWNSSIHSSTNNTSSNHPSNHDGGASIGYAARLSELYNLICFYDY